MNKRIVFFIKNLAVPGGSERVCVVIANKLAEYGFDVVIIEWMQIGKPFYEININIKTYHLFNKNRNIYSTYIISLIKYFNLINKLKPNYIIDVCSALSIISIPVKLLLRNKVITWEHFNANAGWNAFTPKIARWLASKFSDKIVVLTENDKRNFIEKFNAKNIQIILNPVTIATNGKIADTNTKNILAVGRFTEQKGFDMLIEAFELVNKKHIDWTLTIVGSGELFDEIKQKTEIKNLTHAVNLTGASKQMENYYGHAAFFVMSSRFEGLPLVLIEAQAYGLATVSFNCPTGPAEIITNNYNGILVEPNNIKALANAMNTMIEDHALRNVFAANALIASKKYDLDIIIKQWISLFFA